MADFKQALDWLNEGKRVRLPHWHKEEYIYKNLSYIFNENNQMSICSLHAVLHKDWEVYLDKPKHNCINPKKESIRCFEDLRGLVFQVGGLQVMVNFCPICGKSKD